MSRRSTTTPTWPETLQFHQIEVIAYWEGRVTTRHLQQVWNIGSRTTASGLINRYINHAPGNLVYQPADRGYVPSESFSPRFSQGDVNEYLSLISQHPSINPALKLGGADPHMPLTRIEPPRRVVKPEIMRQIIHAIGRRQRVEVSYASQSSPSGEERILVPHTLVSSGIRWHIRAWCEKHREFRDFVLNRIDSILGCYEEPAHESNPSQDTGWQEWITLELMPNPRLSASQQSLIARDYHMEEEQVLRLPTRKALVSYLLDYLNVKLVNDQGSPQEHPLVVRNPDTIRPFVFGQPS